MLQFLHHNRGVAQRTPVAISITLAGFLFAAALSCFAQDQKTADPDQTAKSHGVGFSASKDPDVKQLGLPVYPGARRQKDDSSNDSGLQVGLWMGSSNLKLVVLKMESDDAPAKIKAFYDKALAKYGKVLNCSDLSADQQKKQSGSAHQGELDCDSDHPDTGEIVLKAGSKEKQHIAGITPNGSGTRFELVYVENRGFGDNK